jgi:hypothetical protein
MLCADEGPTTMSVEGESQSATSVPPQYVSCSITPPDSGRQWISVSPVRAELQATCCASGLSRGRVTGTRSEVSRVPSPPAAGASQTSSSATKVIRSRAMCGKRRYEVAAMQTTVAISPLARWSMCVELS